MPPKKQHHDETQSVKEKLQGSRNPRNGRATVLNGSALKEVDNASVHSGQTSSDSNPSNIKWASQDTSVLHNYRRAYRLDTPSTFKNPLSHVVLGQGIGRFSPTMAQPKSKRRVHKDQVAMAVRRHFNALGVTESDVIVDWLYKSKHQDDEFRVRFAPQRK
ncbi:hypothetical protein HBI56_148690 [Parastagonospora nodorum]|uniref:Histone deacetylase complex subunit SAP30 Sin3 binding domain-containing protein n=1 Tax=Phaeosphaeria nodorum (strain SN15 / ATCC MYA-4574 / FGSC 10173) TaxID=321614 RepID=A0A7U2IBP9_PHANO|nr:hypothetical protein HBH56_076180 [Parastagonospora nodorum]QRD06863.1 hypothetical protein JI435_127250 [Parastagonospora nodorum SN15]KAH3927504.1 hypothetical protein HBH54_156420 [Parastagonospora nodorum]KAH3952068.1 hypothetical protein HBH53_051980 [Parastagonospora nodorum]KAH3981784.1 hypothetical protein HBH51_043130 [Parastagonospora nodorum]